MIYLFHIMIFKEVFYLTKKELEQLQKLIQKLEKLVDGKIKANGLL